MLGVSVPLQRALGGLWDVAGGDSTRVRPTFRARLVLGEEKGQLAWGDLARAGGPNHHKCGNYRFCPYCYYCHCSCFLEQSPQLLLPLLLPLLFEVLTFVGLDLKF